MSKVTLKKPLIEALKKHLGVVTSACEVIGISRKTFYEWYREDAEFAEEVDDIKNIALDFAESKLHESIDNGSDTAIIFFLKTQGKNRGYIERTEQKIEINKPFVLEVSDEVNPKAE